MEYNSIDFICNTLKVSRSTVRDWIQAGCPHLNLAPNAKRAMYRLALPQVIDWLAEVREKTRMAELASAALTPDPRNTAEYRRQRRTRKASPAPAPHPAELDPLAEFDPEAGLDDIDASCLADEHADGREVEA